MSRRERTRSEVAKQMRRIGLLEQDEEAPLLYVEALKKLGVGASVFKYYCTVNNIEPAYRRGKGIYFRVSDLDMLDEAIQDAKRNGTLPKNISTQPIDYKRRDDNPQKKTDHNIVEKVANIKSDLDTRINELEVKCTEMRTEIETLRHIKKTLNLESLDI